MKTVRLLAAACLTLALLSAAWPGPAPAVPEDPYRRPEVIKEICYVRDLLFDGKYDEVGPACRGAQEKYPDLLVWHFAAMLAPQARMLELHNWDLSSDYFKEWEKLLELSEKIKKERPYSAYDYLCLGGGYGVVGLHAARGRDYRKAFQVGVKAINYMNKTLETDPQCYDAYLGYGIYHYLRGILSERYRWLPFFAEDRRIGIEQLEKARHGIFAEPLADCAQIYLYKFENKSKEGLELALKMMKEYPDGLLLPQLAGYFQLRLGRYEEALVNFERVLARDAENGPVHLFRGIAKFYLGDIDEAERECHACIDLGSTADFNAAAYYFLGEIAWKRGKYEEARSLWRTATELDAEYQEPKDALMRPVPEEGGQ